eukprot:8814079-Pyramimonas_sp.AAC.1
MHGGISTLCTGAMQYSFVCLFVCCSRHGKREYTRSGHQSQKGRENILEAGTNRRRGERIRTLRTRPAHRLTCQSYEGRNSTTTVACLCVAVVPPVRRTGGCKVEQVVRTLTTLAYIFLRNLSGVKNSTARVLSPAAPNHKDQTVSKW